MKQDFRVDPKNKRVLFDFPKSKAIPRYAYYRCKEILGINNNIENWDGWMVEFPDSYLFTIKQLLVMDEWEW